MLFELTNVTIDENYCTSFATFSSFNFSLSLSVVVDDTTVLLGR